MPDRPIRSSLRSGPGWLRGIKGSITTHCASESQNRSAITASVLQTAALNHKTKASATPWSGSDPKVLRVSGGDWLAAGLGQHWTTIGNAPVSSVAGLAVGDFDGDGFTDV